MVASLFAMTMLYYGLRTAQLEKRTIYLKKFLTFRMTLCSLVCLNSLTYSRYKKIKS